MIACLDLTVSKEQRSSPWSRRTRRELRDLAQSLIVGNLRREQGVGSGTDDDDRVTTVRYDDLEIQSVERRTTIGECHTQKSRTTLMPDGSRPRRLRYRTTANLYRSYLKPLIDKSSNVEWLELNHGVSSANGARARNTNLLSSILKSRRRLIELRTLDALTYYKARIRGLSAFLSL
jgi:hypothetical protein